jgi:hypothetical protein
MNRLRHTNQIKTVFREIGSFSCLVIKDIFITKGVFDLLGADVGCENGFKWFG